MTAEKHGVTVTFLANAGVMVEYRGITLLMDGIVAREGNPFSALPEHCWNALLNAENGLRSADFVLFTHLHPDHFSAGLTAQYVARNPVKAVLLPEDPEAGELPAGAAAEGTECVQIPTVGVFSRTIAPDVLVTAIPTGHLDKKYEGVPHLCWLISCGDKRLLFTGDADYVHENWEAVENVPLDAVFMNPLFFHEACRGRRRIGEQWARNICVYHIPFEEDDRFRMRRLVQRDAAACTIDSRVTVLGESLQRIVI